MNHIIRFIIQLAILAAVFYIYAISVSKAQDNSWATSISENEKEYSKIESDFLIERFILLDRFREIAKDIHIQKNTDKERKEVVKKIATQIENYLNEFNVTNFNIVCDETNNKEYLNTNLMYVEIFVEYDHLINWYIQFGFEENASPHVWIESK